MATAAILDVDGTLVDTNYHHTIAWYRAFRGHGVTLEIWRIHRHIGMGGDQLVAAVAGDGVEERCGDDIRKLEGELYMAMIEEIRPFDGARELIAELREVADPVPGRGQVVVRVEAAGVDRGTWHVMRGLPMIARPALGAGRVGQRRLGADGWPGPGGTGLAASRVAGTSGAAGVAGGDG